VSSLSSPHLEVVLERLRGAGVEIDGEVTARQLAGGRSNETFALELEGEARWVLRRPPLLGRTPTAHDVGREHRVTAALSAAGFPVARPVVLDDDVDWARSLSSSSSLVRRFAPETTSTGSAIPRSTALPMP